MLNQPNPFVNPNQRGIQLPLGCKDLMDVLKMTGGRDLAAAYSSKAVLGVSSGTVKTESGNLDELAPRLTGFFEVFTQGKMFAVSVCEKRVFLAVVGTRVNELVLILFLHQDQAAARDALKQMFENPRFGWKIAGVEYVTVPLPLATNEAVEKLVELLTDGFGIEPEEILTFELYEGLKGHENA